MGNMLLVMDEIHFENCCHCRLRPIDQRFCCALRDSISEYYMKDVPNRRRLDCPLKPMPQEKEDLYFPCNEYEQAFNEGYNRCIDEILGK